MTISSSQIATCRNTIYEMSPTLLPENIASLITTASLATRVSLRCSSLVIDALFEGAKYGTSVSLGLGRNALTNAISTAKLIHLSNPEVENNEQYGDSASDRFIQLIDKYTDLGVHLISSTFTLTELFALSGLQFTSKTIKTGLKACEETVRLIDGIFGSTDTSRAIASIITLVHRELMHDPEFELAQQGKVAMLASLTKALTAFALLQTVTHHQRIKSVQSTVLWQGLVIEEETNQQSLIQMEHPTLNNAQLKKRPGPYQITDTTNRDTITSDTAVSDTENHGQVIHELQGILAESNLVVGNDNDNNSTIILAQDSQDDGSTCCSMYEIITTTQRSTIKTTSIRPVNPNQPYQSAKTKYITVKSEEMDKESFVAVVNSSQDDNSNIHADQVPGVWARYPVTGNNNNSQDVVDNNILLSAVSKKFTRKKLERKESYGWETPEGERIRDSNHQPVGPTTTMTSTSTTLRSTASTSSQHFSSPDDQDDDSISISTSPTSPPSPSPPSRTPKEQKSRWGFSMDNIRQRKSNSISAPSFSLPFYPTTKKSPSLSSASSLGRPSSLPATPDRRRNSFGSSIFPSMTPMNSNDTYDSNWPRRMNRSNSTTSLASISRTTMTTTYSTTTPTLTPSCSTTSLKPLSNDISSTCSYVSCPSSPPLIPTKESPEKDTTTPRRRVRVIRSMPLIRASSAPRSLDQEPNPRNFPRQHIINNIGHFMRYASAAYGESFMRVFGIGDMPSVLPTSHHHHPNHHAFAHHTGVMVQDILLSSYTDHSNLLNMHHPSLHALVHYVTVDHQTKSIVLTCRGTLGLSDILTDLSFTYTDFTLPTDHTKHFQAHDGMLDAAQLLAKQKGKVYQIIRRGLEQYPDYGLVLCGHSLGGGVVSLLGVLWSQDRRSFVDQEPSATVSAALTHDPVPFVTSRLSGLPAGRPVHCYVYGPPCVMSLELSQYCGEGLVTSVVHGYDVVSCLSWGLIKDLKNVATSLHEETRTAEAIISRIIGRHSRRNDDGNRTKDKQQEQEEDQWLWATIKTMRADMRADKLYPPSTVYHVESVPQLTPIHHTKMATSSTASHQQSQHRKAHMTTLTLCDDIHARFSEINFSRSMFVDHTPTLYEKAIRNLCRGFFGQEGAYENT
ncbi:hypothetical protein BC941DRAFT_412259 [Chlamydoabsidia padenii]|nr:hypothetical protein BC941DRAFT_412259 [Chlamydoabsidia padenii]